MNEREFVTIGKEPYDLVVLSNALIKIERKNGDHEYKLAGHITTTFKKKLDDLMTMRNPIKYMTPVCYRCKDNCNGYASFLDTGEVGLLCLGCIAAENTDEEYFKIICDNGLNVTSYFRAQMLKMYDRGDQ